MAGSLEASSLITGLGDFGAPGLFHVPVRLPEKLKELLQRNHGTEFSAGPKLLSLFFKSFPLTSHIRNKKGPGSLSRSNIQHYLCVCQTLFSPIFPPKSKSSEDLLVTDLVPTIM